MDKLLKQLADKVAENGGTLFLVGGAVRDELLGLENKDLDVEAFGLSLEKLTNILAHFANDNGLKLSMVGKSFRVFKLRDNATGEEIDVSLPRRDRKVGEGHRGFEVTADPNMSVKEAASRRDFTINAMMKNLHTGEIVDPFKGRVDLENKVIRMVSETAFAEDPLRALRAVQFAARFGFRVHAFTWMEMQKVNLQELPAERVFGELEKLLLKAERPGLGLKWLCDLGLLPELQALVGVQQDPVWHPEGEAFEHTLMVVDEAAKLIRNTPGLSHEEKMTVMLASLAHDFGKGPATEFLDGHWRAHGHSEAGLPLATTMLDRLNVHTMNGFDVRTQVLALVEHHLVPPQLNREVQKNSKTNVPRSLRRLSQKVRLDLLALVSLADMLGRGVIPAEKDHSKEIFDWFLESAKDCKVEKVAPERILQGRHLLAMGFKPGPQMGEILSQAFELQLDGQLTSLADAQSWVRSLEQGVTAPINIGG